jgi:hypothetical protein
VYRKGWPYSPSPRANDVSGRGRRAEIQIHGEEVIRQR